MRVGPKIEVKNTKLYVPKETLHVKAWGSAAAQLANIFKDLFIGPLAELLVHQLQITLTN